MSNKTITFHNPSDLFNPTPYGFCHTVTAPSNGQLVYISGQSGGEGVEHRLSEDFRQKVRSVLTNLDIALTAHAISFGDVLKITVLIVDHDESKLKVWSDEMLTRWPSDRLPASTLIPVPRLALDGMKIEVDAVAFKAM
ncbi:RidA family protein [Vibrio coralliilyticus]|uniref:Endoribonuclease L-PSP n=1 Tax=Vibrio coralliilyticus TaxID=190893 RepID=A0AAN0SG15_9VIBR|nr:RidA family protein [Vibrio coralliilyticus]AIW21929.1 endoribonuclease L-PSP [Vibrio coralliilyticus]NOH41100.1 RidA family protein [Vibrio coralliilyticus]